MNDIIWHTHHIIPKHMDGTDDPKNLIKVNIPMHAMLHKILWEEQGHWEDELAWRMLDGQISAAEATILAIKKAQIGRKHSEEEIKRGVATARARGHYDWSEERRKKHAQLFIGHKHSDETKIKIGQAHKNKILSEDHRQILSKTHKNKPKSEEQKLKMSESAKKAWGRRKMRVGG